MRVFLDECVPQALLGLLERIARPGHQVDSAHSVGWVGKPDGQLIADVARRGYDVFLTNDLRQLSDPAECAAIKKSGLHHVTYRQPDGLEGLGAACGAICATIRHILADLEAADGQRLVAIKEPTRQRERYKVVDPGVEPPAYWPR
jgi:hypothetical protein